MEVPIIGTFTAGFDLDGVLQDRNAQRVQVAQEMYGATIDPGRCTPEYVTEGADFLVRTGLPPGYINTHNNILTTIQYNEVEAYISAADEHGNVRLLEAPPVAGSLEGIAQIRQTCCEEGLYLLMPAITFRGEPNTGVGKLWLPGHEQFRDIELTSARVLGMTKADLVRHFGCDVYVDDTLSHLKALGRVMTACLLDYPYNRGEDEAQYGVHRVAGWSVLAPFICDLVRYRAAVLRGGG